VVGFHDKTRQGQDSDGWEHGLERAQADCARKVHKPTMTVINNVIFWAKDACQSNFTCQSRRARRRGTVPVRGPPCNPCIPADLGSSPRGSQRQKHVAFSPARSEPGRSREQVPLMNVKMRASLGPAASPACATRCARCSVIGGHEGPLATAAGFLTLSVMWSRSL